MALDLVAHRVDAIVVLGNTPAVLAAKAATSTIPIVFAVGQNPVEMGLVASLNRPGGNVTGVVNLNQQVASKWVEVLHEIVPKSVMLGLLVNPANAAATSNYIREVETAARALGLRIHVLHARGPGDFESAFAQVRQLGAAALAIVSDVLFISHIEQLAATALRYEVPAMYPFRQFAAAGGLASYGTDLLEVYRLAGVYTGRVLRGEKPSDLPVQQATKVEFTLNLRTARALGIDVPASLLARADEVIE
jgi:putative ABC transport system substrate-binding protein